MQGRASVRQEHGTSRQRVVSTFRHPHPPELTHGPCVARAWLFCQEGKLAAAARRAPMGEFSSRYESTVGTGRGHKSTKSAGTTFSRAVNSGCHSPPKQHSPSPVPRLIPHTDTHARAARPLLLAVTDLALDCLHVFILPPSPHLRGFFLVFPSFEKPPPVFYRFRRATSCINVISRQRINKASFPSIILRYIFHHDWT